MTVSVLPQYSPELGGAFVSGRKLEAFVGELITLPDHTAIAVTEDPDSDHSTIDDVNATVTFAAVGAWTVTCNGGTIYFKVFPNELRTDDLLDVVQRGCGYKSARNAHDVRQIVRNLAQDVTDTELAALTARKPMPLGYDLALYGA